MLAESRREQVIRAASPTKRGCPAWPGLKGANAGIRSTRHANGVIAAQFGRYA